MSIPEKQTFALTKDINLELLIVQESDEEVSLSIGSSKVTVNLDKLLLSLKAIKDTSEQEYRRWRENTLVAMLE